MTPYTVEEADADARTAAVAGLLPGALWYAGIGLHVFPLRPLAKVPRRGSAGFKDASSDADVIRAWWTAEPTANIGIAAGHVIDVLDFDGPAAHAAWGREIGAGWGGLKILATVSTPRPGGLHVWTAAKPGRRNKAGMLPGVDFRALGGYVLAPPSLTEVGIYRFLRHPLIEETA